MRPDFQKRVMDLTLLAVALPVVLPLALASALAIRLSSPGPILFAQLRTGKDGQRFRMFKFRTMVRNAGEIKGQLAHLNILEPPDFKIPDDPRITSVGRVLRSTSLDELPQLLNVARGEMSLVGPRPTSFTPETYDLWHARRLEAVPGLTGLWQISGRHLKSFDERLRLDEAYIRQQSVRLDLKILLLTIPAMLRREGA